MFAYIVYVATADNDMRKVINVEIDKQMKLHPSTKKPSEDEITKLVSVLVSTVMWSCVIGIIIDFFVRFLVIESLYQKYKELAKPRQNIWNQWITA